MRLIKKIYILFILFILISLFIFFTFLNKPAVFNDSLENLDQKDFLDSNSILNNSEVMTTITSITQTITEPDAVEILKKRKILNTKNGILLADFNSNWELNNYELNPGNTFIASLTKYNQIQIRFVSSYFPEDLRTFYDELPEGGIHEPGMADPILPPPDRNYVEDIYAEDLIEISTSSYKLYRPKVGTFGYYRSYTMPHNKQMAFYMPINGKYTDELPIWGHEDKWDYLKIKYELINSPEIQEESNKDYSEYIENLFKEADEIVSTLTYVPNE